ncbi:fumarylacetoacetate hydrolase family protein [Psychromarinibacter halotolerans]|uniref:Fumarylacetoacetate hydrolase family protein n=1 Tax=Psychromarinibacter halotolerans TaxID=1775175 RepID=A0ABV7GW60_9RHOB|nr:fumarylacetoacetate hydrolase family protein [Psychromarinibacter halotolerans]MDF0597669.1 fumarylacetoacetate hydrolase family protein [Psychromarinibacter halotolerans]
MRFASVRTAGAVVPGVVDGEDIVLIGDLFADLTALIEAGADGLGAASAAVSKAGRTRVPVNGADLAPPITRFKRDVLCTGWNYWDHFEEGKGRRDGQEVDRPTAPTFFTKSPNAIIGPDDPIAWDPRCSKKWDYECELALVIGTPGRSIPAHRAHAHIFGYCLANDISQRDIQRRHGGQWMRGKSPDDSTPLGPFLVTPDEIDDLGSVRIECELNGEVMQSAVTAQMAFDIPTLIAELSFGMTLNAGDVVLTGTPAGVGNARTPQVFLQAGDVVVTRGTGLGEMRNIVTEQDLYGAAEIAL